jgi:hypothetical protein
MKTKQAWAWLAAGVLAAGLNANYYDGGFPWAHRVAERISHSSQAVLALAGENPAPLFWETRLLTTRHQTASCRLATAMARVQAKIARSEAEVDRESAREDAQLASLEANRARIEAQMTHIRIPAAAFTPVLVRMTGTSVCPRVRVNAPQRPVLNISPMPVIDIATASAGPI